MAKVIDWSPFGPWNGRLMWTDLFDGRVWEVRKGEDFDLAASTIADHIRTEFIRQFGGLNIKVEGDVVRVQRLVGVSETKDEKPPAPAAASVGAIQPALLEG